jgi:hypothetical protein
MFPISSSDDVFPIDIIESSVWRRGCFEKGSHTRTIRKEKMIYSSNNTKN